MTAYDLNIVSLVVLESDAFQNGESLPYATCAWDILWLMASMVGFAQEIIEPKCLILSLDGVGVESMKAGGVRSRVISFQVGSGFRV